MSPPVTFSETNAKFRSAVDPKLLFTGRTHDPRIGGWVIPLEVSENVRRTKTHPVVLVGMPDDTGVVLNHGRPGAQGGPDAIRKHFYKMTLPMDLQWESSISLFDAGNLVPSKDILETQKRAASICAELASSGATLIALGGGHDFAAPDFLGFVEGLEAQSKKKPKVGLINVDPHLDVRVTENGLPHSGTPFRQILESGKLRGQDFIEFGIRSNRNSRDYFEYARSKKVTIQTLEQIREKTGAVDNQYFQNLRKISQSVDWMGATFDMDSCSEAEGVSAPPVIGFTAWEMYLMAQSAGSQKKVRFLEICEVAPALDPTEKSARIAAEMIYAFLRARAESV